MILYINVYITETKFGTRSDQIRQNAKYSDKLDTFKYMLSSLADYYNWTKVIINCKLDDFYKPRSSELYDFIEKNFGKYPLLLRNYRNEYQKQWKEDYSLLDDDMIFFCCNHDHIFIDPDPSYFSNLVEKYRNYDNFLGIQVTHWQEHCSWLFHNISEHGDIKIYDDHFSLSQKVSNSCQVINKKTYHHWWCEFDLKDQHFPRSDGLVTVSLDTQWWFKPMTIVIPYREIARHFDAYSHNPWVNFTNDRIPVLEIPNGFFENSLRINYSTTYRNGYTNINPVNLRLKIFDPKGTDLNIPQELLPLFWKDKIIEYKDDMKFLSSMYKKEEIYKNYINRILNLWNEIPNNGSESGIYLRQQIYYWYMKLYR